MNRRAMITSAPAMLAAFPAAVAAPSDMDETAIIILFRRHRALIVAARLDPANEEVLESRYYTEADMIEREIMASPCTCAADFAAKVIIGTCEGGIFTDWETGEIWREARALTGCAV